uniref:RNA-directed RNA polymerase n=1 Tax=Leviviridae sp. TaxID=2027243 RepID=A0A514D5H8_9VIRU|nr:MAG: RNA-dependent RNA polymerase [Leviviridae sp.]
MEIIKSLDEQKFIAAVLRDVFETHADVFNYNSRENTLRRVKDRLSSEGMGFLTKSLPKLGKALDKALSLAQPLNANILGFEALDASQLPRLLGELFVLVLDPTGLPLQEPSVGAIRSLRQFLYLFYKYELPYSAEDESKVISKFEQTEVDLVDVSKKLALVSRRLDLRYNCRFERSQNRLSLLSPRQYEWVLKEDITLDVITEARRLLKTLFAHFDPYDIVPRHGPGAVASGQRYPWQKYQWTNIADRLSDQFPLDAYFSATLGQVCDERDRFQKISSEVLPAKVVLVPKDSRGPRLISCEPVDFQWIQQGVSRAIVDLVERHPLTKDNVMFTNQQANQFGALLGSSTGRYATLDLQEASDRISVELVRLLFPERITNVLLDCRTSATKLPDGRVLPLCKFAPMGSALCFPIMALSIWAILTAVAKDKESRERILVYGDDVVVQTAQAEDAIMWLESFGLKVNKDKSCLSGRFRESCGVDAFNGENVTPVRLRTVWESSPSAEAYVSWISYANDLFKRSYFYTYNHIVDRLHAIYGAIPAWRDRLSAPSLIEVAPEWTFRVRTCPKGSQKREYRVWDIKCPIVIHELSGWNKLLRFFIESGAADSYTEPDDYDSHKWERAYPPGFGPENWRRPFRVSEYTLRRTSILVRRWR